MQLIITETGSTLRADTEFCRRMIRVGSKSFHAASLLLPRSVREPAHTLYAFCRLSDDAVDTPSAEYGAVGRLADRLDKIYAGRPGDHPADRALATVVQRYAIPKTLPAALLEGLAWDAEGRRYETLSELTAYAVRVAGSVGAMMAVLMGRRATETVSRAIDLGVAMQLTNIARDVGEDASLGRLYLPRVWLRDAGIDPDAWMAEPQFTQALGTVVQRLLRSAETFYARADAGVAQLPITCRPAIRAARLIYSDIGRRIEANRLDSVSTRAFVSSGRKAWLLGRAVLPQGAKVESLHAQPIAEGRYLVAAVAQEPFAEHLTPMSMTARYVRIIELFERLERADRARRTSALDAPDRLGLALGR